MINMVGMVWLTKKQKAGLGVMSIVLVGLVVSLVLVGERQLIQKRAAGTGEVNLLFFPSARDVLREEAIPVSITLHKINPRTILISGAQAVISVGSAFTIDTASVRCLWPFDKLAYQNVTGQIITVMCAIGYADPLVSLTTDQSFAAFNVTVRTDVAYGADTITFMSTRVTEAGVANQAPDVSTAGTPVTYTIVAPPPTPTPIPTSTPTPTSTPIPTATRTPTPTPYPCSRGALGNLNCSSNGCIDTSDFELFRQNFGKSVDELVIPYYFHTPNLNGDNIVDSADFEIFRQGFGTCNP